MLKQYDIDFFNRGRVENPRYWKRFGGKPDFTDAVVVDLGCGHGSLCIDIALSGARRVIGLELNPDRIDFANENLKINYPQLANIVEFRLQNLQDTPESEIDYFVSKDAFEHVIELEQVLAEIKKHLKLGGRVYTGFGPLWNSPFGDHGKAKMLVPWGPWGHALFKEQFLVNWHNYFDSNKVTSIHELGLNMLSLAEYLSIFHTSGMKTVFLKVNDHEWLVSRLFSLIRKIPFLEEYFSHNIYCILEKR
jgi:SAM-dependent methyltransferase